MHDVEGTVSELGQIAGIPSDEGEATLGVRDVPVRKIDQRDVDVTIFEIAVRDDIPVVASASDVENLDPTSLGMRKRLLSWKWRATLAPTSPQAIAAVRKRSSFSV